MRADQQHAKVSGRRQGGRLSWSYAAAASVTPVLLAAGLLTAATWFGPGAQSARAADGSSGSGGQKIAVFGGDLTIGRQAPR